MLKSLGRVLSVLFICSTIFSQSTSPAMLGFSAESARAQTALEARFDSGLNPNNLRDWMKRISARPHHIGSAFNKENADFIASQFRSWGNGPACSASYTSFRLS